MLLVVAASLFVALRCPVDGLDLRGQLCFRWPVWPQAKQAPEFSPPFPNLKTAAAKPAFVKGPPTSLHAFIQYSSPLLLCGLIAALHSLLHCSYTNCLTKGIAVSGSPNILPAASTILATKSEKGSTGPCVILVKLPITSPLLGRDFHARVARVLI